MQKRILLLLFYLNNIIGAVAQDTAKDTSQQQVKVPTVIHYLKHKDILNNEMKFYSLDTTLDDIEIVQRHVKYFYNNLSNNGSASTEQVLNLHAPLLTELGNYSFDLQRTFTNQIRYYKTNKRFSELTFHQGGGKESQIELTMAQNIFSNWNLGLDFRRLGSLGFLNRGTTFNSNFDAFTWYHTKNERYNLFASALWNSIRDRVNGGITSDSLFNNNDYSNSELGSLEVYLTDATQHRRNHSFSVVQFYHFGYKKALNDSTRKHEPLFKLQTNTEYESGSYTYGDNSDANNFYQNRFFSVTTSDSLHYEQLTNRITLAASPVSLAENKYRLVNAELTAGYQTFELTQLFINKVTENSFAEASLFGSREEKKIDYTLKAKYVYDGDNKDDYSAEANVKIPLLIFGNLQADFFKTLYSPTILQSVYQSNHFAWYVTLDKSEATYYSLKYELPKYHLSLGGSNCSISDYIYFDNVSGPSQFSGPINVKQAFIQKNFHFGKFRLNNTAYWQSVDANVIPLPDFALHHSLFIEIALFKKKLPTQFGVDVHYTSEYYAPAYNPAVSVFYIQDSVKTNGYALADIFFNFKIKTARVFIKLHNAGDGIIAKGYYLTPHYPMPGRVFQFGLNWRFFD
jgi:hypothetical protein